MFPQAVPRRPRTPRRERPVASSCGRALEPKASVPNRPHQSEFFEVLAEGLA